MRNGPWRGGRLFDGALAVSLPIPSRQANRAMRAEAVCRVFGVGVPYGIRTRVTAVKGRCPRPLDEGDPWSAVDVPASRRQIKRSRRRNHGCRLPHRLRSPAPPQRVTMQTGETMPTVCRKLLLLAAFLNLATGAARAQNEAATLPSGGDPALVCKQKPNGRAYWVEYGFCDLPVRGPARAKGLVL